VDRFDALLLDLDGVVYVGDHAVAHAASALRGARSSGVSIAYVTNNASRPPADVAEHLRRIGLDVAPDDVVTSAQAGAHLMESFVAAGATVLAVGGPGVAQALTDRGFAVVRDRSSTPAAVMQGFGRDLTWQHLAEAAYALAGGIPWIATNRDLTVPTPDGPAPGNGSFVRLLAAVVGREPDAVAGKPESTLALESIERVGATAPVMVGDRLDTDIEAGHRAGIPALLVLTGVTDARTLLTAAPHHRPHLLSVDLRGLADEHPGVDSDGAAFRCGRATATVLEGALTVSGPATTASEVACQWRAAASAAWASAVTPDIEGAVRHLDALCAAVP
jgi:HAD superfamily hydrolase (TIGR01450 family)